LNHSTPWAKKSISISSPIGLFMNFLHCGDILFRQLSPLSPQKVPIYFSICRFILNFLHCGDILLVFCQPSAHSPQKVPIYFLFVDLKFMNLHRAVILLVFCQPSALSPQKSLSTYSFMNFFNVTYCWCFTSPITSDPLHPYIHFWTFCTVVTCCCLCFVRRRRCRRWRTLSRWRRGTTATRTRNQTRMPYNGRVVSHVCTRVGWSHMSVQW